MTSETKSASVFALVLRLLLALLRTALSLLLLFGLASHFWLKDKVTALAFVYYSAPLPILAGVALLLGWLWRCERRNERAKICYAFALAAVLVWSYESLSWNGRAPSPGAVKVVCWNAAGNRDAEGLARYVAGFNAEVIGIVEAGIRTKQVSTWQKEFPGQTVEKLSGGMALITKGKILASQSGSLGGRGRFNLVEISLRDMRVQLLLVDLDSDPFRSRLRAFASLVELLRAHAQDNLIVMGDFNTPEDSIFFEAFHEQLRHAFAAGGRGYAKSWPLPAPLLTIDHIWVSRKIDVLNCTLDWNTFSDHRPVVAELALPLAPMSVSRMH